MNRYKFEDIYIGLNGSFSVTLDEEKVQSFLKISGDINPLHVDANFAKKKGFDDKVVYGLLTSSFYSALVGVYIPGELALLHGIEIQFKKPVYIGDELKVSGNVTYINEAYKQIEVKANIVNQDSEIVSKAKIKIGLNE